jgi:hypothetical protein
MPDRSRGASLPQAVRQREKGTRSFLSEIVGLAPAVEG